MWLLVFLSSLLKMMRRLLLSPSLLLFIAVFLVAMYIVVATSVVSEGVVVPGTPPATQTLNSGIAALLQILDCCTTVVLQIASRNHRHFQPASSVLWRTSYFCALPKIQNAPSPAIP